MAEQNTRWDRLLEKLKNHRVLASLGIIGFVIVGVASVVGSLDLIASTFSNLTRKSEVSVVSVDVYQDNLLNLFLHEIWYDIEPNDFPAIDVLIKNNTDKTRILTNATLKVTHARRVEYDPCPNCLSTSIGAIYSLSVDTFTVGQNLDIPASLELRPDAANRVQFVIGSRESWEVKADLIFEFDDGQMVSAGSIEFRILHSRGGPPDVGFIASKVDPGTLMRHVQSTEPSLITSSARVIAQLRYLELVPVLRERLNTVDPAGMGGIPDMDFYDRLYAAFVRGSLLDGLAQLQEVEVLPLLMPYLESDDFYTRFFAVAALSRISDPRVQQQLQRLGDNATDATIQCAALLALGKLGFSESREYIQNFIREEILKGGLSPERRAFPGPAPIACGVRALGMLDDPSSIDFLHHIVRESAPSTNSNVKTQERESRRSFRIRTRKEAILALGMIGRESEITTDAITEAFQEEAPDWYYLYDLDVNDLPFEYVVYWALQQISADVYEAWVQSLGTAERERLDNVIKYTENGWRAVMLDQFIIP